MRPSISRPQSRPSRSARRTLTTSTRKPGRLPKGSSPISSCSTAICSTPRTFTWRTRRFCERSSRAPRCTRRTPSRSATRRAEQPAPLLAILRTTPYDYWSLLKDCRNQRMHAELLSCTILRPAIAAATERIRRRQAMAQPFDMSLVQRGARLRRSPYYEAEQKYGPEGYTVYNHMLFPIRFDTFEKEFEYLLNDVTLWDVSVERCVEIDGPDGFKLTQLMTPRDLSKCAVGQAKYVLICAKDGGILNDP